MVTDTILTDLDALIVQASQGPAEMQRYREVHAAVLATLAGDHLRPLVAFVDEAADDPLPPIGQMTEEALRCRLAYLQGCAQAILGTVERDIAKLKAADN